MQQAALQNFYVVILPLLDFQDCPYFFQFQV